MHKSEAPATAASLKSFSSFSRNVKPYTIGGISQKIMNDKIAINA
jgi:hypothetical protein